MKLRLPATIAALAAILLSLVWVAAPASAHINAVSATCDQLTVDLQLYNESVPNEVSVSVDDVLLTNKESFTQEFKKTYPFDRYVAHTYEVKVTAGDDTDGSQGWTFDESGTTTPCEDDNPDKVALCHATPPDTAANGWELYPEVSKNAVLKNGHAGHTKDIIPSFSYLEKGVTKQFPGLNWDSSGQAMYANGCKRLEGTPVNPTVTQSTECDVQGSLTIPTTTGVEYLLNGNVIAAGTHTGPKSGTLTARAADGYTLTNPNWSYNVNIPAANDCPTEATPVNPTVTQSTECDVQGSLTIPTTTGVEYLLDGDVVTGKLTGPLTGTLTARAADGYTLTNPNWSYNVNIPAANDCPTEATPVNPTVTQSTECDVQGSLTIPTTTGVEYLLDDDVVTGKLTGPLTGTLTARAADGYTLTNPNWSYNVNIPAANDCPTEATPVNPTVTQSAKCDVQGSLTIPTTTGVEYLLDGDVVTGTLNGPLTGTLTARAAEGYQLTDAEWTFDVNIPAAAKCLTTPTPTPTPTEVAVLNQTATAPTAPAAAAALASTGSSLTGYATAAAAALLAGTAFMMATRRRRELAPVVVETETD